VVNAGCFPQDGDKKDNDSVSPGTFPAAEMEGAHSKLAPLCVSCDNDSSLSVDCKIRAPAEMPQTCPKFRAWNKGKEFNLSTVEQIFGTKA